MLITQNDADYSRDDVLEPLDCLTVRRSEIYPKREHISFLNVTSVNKNHSIKKKDSQKQKQASFVAIFHDYRNYIYMFYSLFNLLTHEFFF